MKSNTSALIADDDEFLRHALEAILRNSFSFTEVSHCDSFDGAMEALQVMGGFDLAVFDLSMPGVQNPSNLRAVRECFPDTVAVVVSASEKRSDMLKALGAGVHGYIVKQHGILKLTEAFDVIFKGHIVAPWSLSTVADDHVATEYPAEKAARSTGPIDLTPRQTDVLKLLVEGKSNKEIARTLKLGEGTVKVHMTALFRALEVNSRAAAAAFGAKYTF